MHATMALFSPPRQATTEGSKTDSFACSEGQLWQTISTGCVQKIISQVAQKVWFRNRNACEKNNIFSPEELRSELSLRLFEEATKHAEEGILGLKCPQMWNDISFSAQRYIYKIVYYLALRSVRCSATDWQGLPIEQYRMHYANLLTEVNPIQEQERALFFGSYLAYFKPMASYFLEQRLLSPSAFFIFALFHFPQELTQDDWEQFIPYFPHAQADAFTLFGASTFSQLQPDEGIKFTARVQFLSWLLLGAGYPNLSALQRSPQAQHLYTIIRQAKNSARQKIFRYLLCLLICCEHSSLEELKIEWERLLYQSLRLNPLAIIRWKQRCGTMEDLYTIVFTTAANFQQYREASHLADHRYKSFIYRFSELQHYFYTYWEKALLSLSN